MNVGGGRGREGGRERGRSLCNGVEMIQSSEERSVSDKYWYTRTHEEREREREGGGNAEEQLMNERRRRNDG